MLEAIIILAIIGLAFLIADIIGEKESKDK